MQDKLKKLFQEINIEDTVLTCFENSSIEKVVLYDQNKIIEFLINTENLIPIEIYNELLDKLTNTFNTFELVKLVIIPNNIDYSKLKDYYLSIMNEICIDRFKYQIFLDRNIDIENNTITIKAYNKIECTDLIKLKQELIDKLFNYGFKVEINIDLVLEGDKELIDKIEHEKEISEEVSNNNPNPVPKKEIDEPKKTPYRAKKSAEITEMSRLIKEAVSKLPPKERTVVEYRFYRNMQVKDIATQIGLSSSRVTRIVQASLNSVKEYLNSKGLQGY